MPKLTAPCTLLAVVLALVWAASADAADVTTLPAGIGIDGGPVFAGDGLLVVEERDMDNEVVLRGADGSFRVLAGPAGFVRSWADRFFLSASADRFAVTQSRSGKGSDYVAYSAQGPLTGGPAQPTCGGGIVSGRAFASRCDGKELVIEDPDNGERRFRLEMLALALEGRFLAYRTETEVIVLDRITGNEEYRVAASTGTSSGGHALDVDAEGTVAFTDDRELTWASVREPSPHRLSAPGARGPLRVAGGRVAFEVTSRNGSFHDVRVWTLAGEQIGEVISLAPQRAWDFDGRRLAYTRTPCALTSLVVFEPGAEPTPSLGTRCGKATVLTRSVPLRSRREVTITVSCPRTATAGCGSYVRLCSRGFDCADRFYAGLPGATDRVRLRFSAEEAARIRRSRVRQLTLEVGSVERRLAVR